MEVKFTVEKMMQIDTIKKAIQKDFKNLGFEHRPEAVDDKLALDYALSFTSEYMVHKSNPELLKE